VNACICRINFDRYNTEEKHIIVFCSFYCAMHYSAKRSLEIAYGLSVRLSVCLWRWWIMTTYGWKSWKLIARTISPTSSLFPGNMEKFWGKNVRSTPTSITSGWIESTESHVISGGGVAVYLLLSAHRAVIFVIAQLSRLHSLIAQNRKFAKSQVNWTGVIICLYTLTPYTSWKSRVKAN